MSLPEGVTIEEGRFYRRRDGKVIGPATRIGVAGAYPWNLCGDYYTARGTWTLETDDDSGIYDLVEMVSPPCPDNPAGVGDTTSDAKGSGARFNTGKPPVELIPVWILAACAGSGIGLGSSNPFCVRNRPPVDVAYEARQVLDDLGEWQRGEVGVSSVLQAFEADWTTDAAAVFDYGRKKYAEWNWAKGMPWSVPTACAVRHLLAILRGEENDPESGLPHRGHVACNLVMLAQYESTYREGDDRPLKWIAPPKAA